MPYFSARRSIAGATLLVMVLSAMVLPPVAAAQVPAAGSEALPEAGSGSVRMSNEEMRYTVMLTRGLMSRYASEPGINQARTKALLEIELERQVGRLGLKAPRGVYQDTSRASIIYLSVYAPNGAKLTAEGRGKSAQAAVLDAISGLMISEHWKQLDFSANLKSVRIAYDLVWGLEPYIVNMAEPFLYSFTPGLDGLIYENSGSRSVLVPWEAVRQAWSVLYMRHGDGQQAQEHQPVYGQQELKQAMFRELIRRASMTMGTYQAPSARMLRFRTQSFIERQAGGDGGDVLVIFRVGPIMRPEDLNEGQLTTSISSAADYLARAPQRSGAVRDGYDPLRLVWSGQGGMRPDQQAICLEALARLHQTRKEAWTLQGARLLLDTLAGGIQGLRVQGLDKESRQTAFASYDGRSETSWHAQMLLGVVALEEIAPAEAQRNLIRHLANTLLSVQKSDGSFMHYVGPGTEESLMEGDREDRFGASLNLLALVRGFEVLKDDELLRRARLTADHLVLHREKALGRQQNEGLADVHLIAALGALDRHEVNDAYVNYARLCAGQILKLQAADPMRYPRDEWGGFGESGAVDTYFSAFSLRGLGAAGRMAAHIRGVSPARYEKLELQSLENAVNVAGERAIAYLLGMQYTPENSFYAEEPRIAAGGFRHSATDSRISTVTVATWLLSQAERQQGRR